MSNITNSHYVLLRDFNRFVTNKTKHHGKKILPAMPQKLKNIRKPYRKVCLAINN